MTGAYPRFPLLMGVHRALWRALHPFALAGYVVAVLGTVACIRLGIDERARAFFLERIALGSTTERFLHLQLGMLWPVVPALWTFRGGYYANDRRRIAGACATLQAIIVTGLVTAVIKLATGRPPPAIGGPADEFHFLDRTNGANAFVMWPSGHTSEAFAAAGAIGVYARARWVKGGVYVVAALMALSMLAWNFHWASDVIAGALVGHPIGRAVGRNFADWAAAAWAEPSKEAREALPPAP